jgi:hypothetical protein
MGSKGIRRRKPARHLPKVRARDLPTENDVIPPNIMWPDKGSGFEANPFSPAGSAQRQWWAINAARRGGSRRVRSMGWLFIVLIGAPLLLALIFSLIQQL